MLLASGLLCVLFILALQHKLSWWHGYAWVLILFVAHSATGLYGLYKLAAGPVWLRLALVSFVPLVVSLWGVFWFWLANFINQRMASQNSFVTLLVWLIALWCLYWCLIFYPLIFFGLRGCYLPLNPLLALVNQPLFLLLLPAVGAGFLLLLFLGIIALCAYVWFERSARMMAGIAALLCALAFLNKYMPCESDQAPDWLTEIGVLQQRFSVSNSMMEEIKQLRDSLQELKNYHCVLTPEACVYDHHFFSVPDFYKKWAEQPVQKQAVIIAGFRWIKGNYYNSLFYINNGAIQAVFDKRHTLPILEHMPAWLDGELLRRLYFSATPVRSAGSSLRPLWHLRDGVLVVPYICSELLARQQPDDSFPGVMLLAVCNDAWAPAAACADMLLVARYQAIAWQRDIIYVSYAHAFFINKRGVNRKISETSINIYE